MVAESNDGGLVSVFAPLPSAMPLAFPLIEFLEIL